MAWLLLLSGCSAGATPTTRGTTAGDGGTAPATSQGAAPGDVCLSGVLKYDFRDAEAGTDKPLVTSPARGANWELWGRTAAAGAARKLTSGVTDATGKFQGCHNGGPLREVQVRFHSSARLWRVVRNRGSESQYSFVSGVNGFVAVSRDLGVVKVPADMRNAWHVTDTLNLLYAKRANPVSECWTRHQHAGTCDQLTVVWEQKDTEDAGYWDHGATNHVILAGDMTDSKHLILHEAGHWWQWQLHNRRFPEVTDCDPHHVEKRSSPSCAWTEGFADAVAAYALGDYRYVDEDGNTHTMRNDRSTPDWDAGDAVQGRVGSCLLDLWAAGGPDGGNWDRTISLMTATMSAHFREYFTAHRPAASLSTTGPARNILGQHTINY